MDTLRAATIDVARRYPNSNGVAEDYGDGSRVRVTVNQGPTGSKAKLGDAHLVSIQTETDAFLAGLLRQNFRWAHDRGNGHSA